MPAPTPPHDTATPPTMTPPRDARADGGDDDATDDLADRVEAIVAGWDRVERVEMFGLPSFTARGELFCVASSQGVSLTRLPDDDRAALEAVADVGPFDAGGRTVERWATVTADDLPDDEALEPFLRAAYGAALEEAT